MIKQITTLTILISIMVGFTVFNYHENVGTDLSVLTPTEIVLSKVDTKVIPVDKIHTSEGEIKVENTDDNSNETFVIKSDKEVYSGGNFDMIISVTNLREDEEGTLKLVYSKGETLNSVSRYIPVNSTIDVPIYSDVEISCPKKATSTPCYENTQTGTETQNIIIDSWENIVLKDKTTKSNLLKKETTGEYDDKEIKYLFPKGTTFLKLNISYEDTATFRDKFYIEIFGEDGGYGLLDPLIMKDVFTGTTIDTAKWDETDPDGIISQDGILTILTTTVNSARFDNMLKSDDTITSGVVVGQVDFDQDASSGTGGYSGLVLYVDANNWIEFGGRGNETHMNIYDGGSLVYNVDTGIASPSSNKITYDLTSKDVKFWYYNAGWTQLGSTQTADIGSTVYAVLTAGTNTGWGGTKLTFDNFFFSDEDYSEQYPAVPSTEVNKQNVIWF